MVEMIKPQSKRKATETLAWGLAVEEACKDQKWSSLIAYEQGTACADSWENLKTFIKPVNDVCEVSIIYPKEY